MLFNSFEFILLFLPITVAGYFLICHFRPIEYGLVFLLIASLFFYGYWNPIYLFLISGSILVNFYLGQCISRYTSFKKRTLLIIGVTLNLGLLTYYKYFNFFVENINYLTGVGWEVEAIILPLAISFFTFQQISYLVDAYQGRTSEYNLLHYAFFVSFFPQLIAGPIVHHKEMMPQFLKRENISPKLINFAIGISVFSIGLFKKTVIADSLSAYVQPVYDGQSSVDFVLAWSSTLAYTFQLYFDFSGYSDMAVGCARIFGIKLPINFFSPYKSLNIIDFWRRWHITLSRFLRDYLYIPLGGNQSGVLARYKNLLITMLLGGLWHGAGWTFVIWGGLHGCYLIVNHGWHWLSNKIGFEFDSHVYRLLSWILTFLAVSFSWVFFRSPDLARALEICQGLFGLNGIELPSGVVVRLIELQFIFDWLGITTGTGSGSQFMFSTLWIVFAAWIALLLPNCAQIFARHEIVLYENNKVVDSNSRGLTFCWETNMRWCLCTALMLAFGLLTLGQVSEFLYFQF